MKTPQFWGIHAKPGKWARRLLAIVPFLLLIALYVVASNHRLAENPQDKILPSLSKMASTVQRLAFEEDQRTGDILLWTDTASSLSRLGMGIGLSFLVSLLVGLNLGIYRGFRALFNPFVTFLSMVPPLAILPILFIAMGVGELAKVMLIFIGTVPILIRDNLLTVTNMPAEQRVKAMTLGASSSALTYRIILPQILPSALNSLRLVLGAAWLFLIASEAIASTDGLGYRIFLVRRYLAMDVIIPYVLWITLLGFLIDWLLKTLNRSLFKWYHQG